MSSPNLGNLNTAIYKLFVNDTTLTDLIDAEKIFKSYVPDRTQHLYMSLGDFDSRPSYTHSSDGYRVNYRIRIYLVSENETLAWNIQQRIRELLFPDPQLVVEGACLTGIFPDAPTINIDVNREENAVIITDRYSIDLKSSDC